MNNEIKEILDYLSDDSKSFIICGVSYYKISDYKTKILLDYITNLQEENIKLKELCNKYEEEHKTTFEYWKQLVKEDYKSRNEKAIEYINSKHNWYGDEEEDNEDYLFELEDFEKLLNILKGDNK